MFACRHCGTELTGAATKEMTCRPVRQGVTGAITVDGSLQLLHGLWNQRDGVQGRSGDWGHHHWWWSIIAARTAEPKRWRCRPARQGAAPSLWCRAGTHVRSTSVRSKREGEAGRSGRNACGREKRNGCHLGAAEVLPPDACPGPVLRGTKEMMRPLSSATCMPLSLVRPPGPQAPRGCGSCKHARGRCGALQL